MDVHIAVQLVSDVLSDRFERAIITSADSDLAPAIRLVKQSAPMKEIFAPAPPGRFATARRKQLCSRDHTGAGREALISRKTFRQRQMKVNPERPAEDHPELEQYHHSSTFKESATRATIDRPHHLQRPHTLRAALRTRRAGPSRTDPTVLLSESTADPVFMVPQTQTRS